MSLESKLLGWVPSPISSLAILPNVVHIWKARLFSPTLLSLSNAILTDDEKKRAAQIKVTVNRQRFKTARACLRDILSRYLDDTDPCDIYLERTNTGKPFIANPSSNIKFSVAHTGHLGLIAISLVEVGIDIEWRNRPLKNMTGLLRTRLTDYERSILLHVSRNVSLHDREDLLRARFLKMWTRKEAVVKCTGDGIAQGFKRFEIIENVQGLDIKDLSTSTSLTGYSVFDLSPDDLYFAALAMASDKPHDVAYFQYLPRNT